MATLREVLNPWGLERIKIDPWLREHLDIELKSYEFACSSPRNGAEPHGMLQTSCGGVVIASFYPTRNAWPLVLRVNDMDGEVWDSKRIRGELPPACGPRPHPVLELVQTA